MEQKVLTLSCGGVCFRLEGFHVNTPLSFRSESMVPLGLSEDRVPPVTSRWGQPPRAATGQPARTERAEPGVGVRQLKDLALRGRALPSLGRGSSGHLGGVGRRGAELLGTG